MPADREADCKRPSPATVAKTGLKWSLPFSAFSLVFSFACGAASRWLLLPFASAAAASAAASSSRSAPGQTLRNASAVPLNNLVARNTFVLTDVRQRSYWSFEAHFMQLIQNLSMRNKHLQRLVVVVESVQSILP